MAYGTAPRKIDGVWRTRSGRKLSSAGQAYWNRLQAQGRTDGQGHITQHVVATRASAPPKKPSFETLLKVKRGDPAAIRQFKEFSAHVQGKKEASAAREAATVAQAPAFESAIRASAKAAPVVNPVAASVIKGLSPTTALEEAGRAALKKNVPEAALALSSVFPVGRGARLATGVERAVKAERAAARAEAVSKAGLSGSRALVAGEKAQQVTRARSRVTQNVIEKPADAISRRLPNARLVGERARVAKHAGREVREEQGQARAVVHAQARALPKKGSDEDVAHFWFAHLPPEQRNAEGLRAVRVGLQRELDRTLRREPIVSERKASKSLLAKRARVARLQKAFDRASERVGQRTQPAAPSPNVRASVEARLRRVGFDEEQIQKGLSTAERLRDLRRRDPEKFASYVARSIGNVKRGQGHIAGARPGAKSAQHAFGLIVRDALDEAARRGTHVAFDATATSSPTVQRLGGALSVAKDELATAEKRFARPLKPGKARLAGLPAQARNLAIQIVHLDRIIAANPKANQNVLSTLDRFDKEHSRVLQEVGLLEGVDQDARRAIVAHWLGMKPSGEEIYIGHRADKVRGSGGLRSVGLGKPKIPQGATQRNRLRLVRTGGVRPSTHVAAEDLLAAQTYRDALRARKDLWQMGQPFKGHLPEGYNLVNPEGQVVPATMKTDRLAAIADQPGKVEEASRELLRGFLGDQANWEDMVEEARQAGTLKKLRIVPERDVKRYYAQFLPAGTRTAGGYVYDKLIDATALSLIFGRLGYIPKQFLQGLVTAVPHQGVFFPINVVRAAQLIPKPGSSLEDRKLWDLLVQAVGGGVSGSLSEEATSKVLSKPASVMTRIGDAPLRVSAFLHEAAAHGVIPKVSLNVTARDKHDLLRLLTDPAQKPTFNDVRQIAKDAMGDFDRFTPKQRRYARRFLIVPGWLAAGTRYPIHFAATHPGRAAALAYAAAGEPGAPKQAQVNKPVTDYLQKGLPSYVQAVSAEHLPSFLGGGKGKSERLQSLLPGSIPFDIGLAASQGAPLPTAASYVNPLPEALSNIVHGVYETPSGETHKTTFTDALVSNLQRLAPGEAYVQGMIDPGSVPSKMYPDHSRLGLTAREFGVVPVKIDKQAAQRAQFSERGMTQSINVVDDQQAFFQQLDQAGYEPDPQLRAAYRVRLGRAQRLDKIHAHGLAYQQKAYRSDVAYAVSLGKVDRKLASQMVAGIKGATEDEISRARDEMRDAYFGGDEIRQAKAELRAAITNSGG